MGIKNPGRSSTRILVEFQVVDPSRNPSTRKQENQGIFEQDSGLGYANRSNSDKKIGKETEKTKSVNTNSKVKLNKVQLKPIKFNPSANVVKFSNEQKLKELHMKNKEKKPMKNRNGKVGVNKNDPDIEQVRMDKKTMNILFNGVNGDMFDNIINCKTAKEVWDTIQIICDGTEQEWKPMSVSLRNSQDYKEFTLERLYGILKTYELEIEQDERMEKGRKKGGSIALVAEIEKEKEVKVEAVESTSKVCENKGKDW
ncbi:hypothetical protein AgCh_004532 [Apium graveolens]